MLKFGRPLPGQIVSPMVVLTMTGTLHSQCFPNCTNPRDSNKPSSSFMTCAHINKSGGPMVFSVKTLRYLSQYAGFREKCCILRLMQTNHD